MACFLLDLDFVGRRITELRMKANISEREMSEQLGMGENYIQGISSNRQLPSLKMLFRICEYFDISLREFFCENEIQALILNITESMNDLDEEDLLLLMSIIRQFKGNEKYKMRIYTAYMQSIQKMRFFRKKVL